MKIFGQDYDTDDLEVIAKDVNERWENVKKWHEEDNTRHNETINGKNEELQLLHKVLLELAFHPSHILGEGVKKALASNGIALLNKDGKAYLKTS